MTDRTAGSLDPAAPDIGPGAALPLRACLVVLAGSLFAVDVAHAREVAVFDTLTAVPRSASVLLGVANLRGLVVPIVDVRPLLGLPAHRPGALIKGLVVEEGSVRAAIAIEAALGLEAFDQMITAERSEYVQGMLPRGEETVALLDTASLITALARELGTADEAEEDRG
jgi:purine-binding chemotaxis protein CheW